MAVVAASGVLGHDLIRLHCAVTERALESHVDEVAVFDLATELVESHHAAASGIGPVIIFLPGELTRPERVIVGALSRASRIDVIVGQTRDADVDAAVTAQFADQFDVANEEVAATASRVIHASDADDEVRAIVREILAQLGAGTPAHRIAALYARPVPYARLLHDHLAAAGITTNGPGVRAVRDRALADGFLAFLRLDPEDLRRVAVFDWLGRVPVRTRAGDSVPRTAWERLSRAAGVTGGDWTERLEAYRMRQQAELDAKRADPDASDRSVAYSERALDEAAGLDEFITELVVTLSDGRNCPGWAELAEWALAAFRRYIGPGGSSPRLPEPEQRAATAIETTLRSLSELDGIGGTPSLAELVEILDVDLDQRRPRVGRFGEGVFVGPVSSAASLDVADLFVMGLSEDQYPGPQNADPLLPDAVRAATDGALETERDRRRTIHRDLLAALAVATNVTASFPRGDLRRGSERLPSRWLMPSIRRLDEEQRAAERQLRNDEDALVSPVGIPATKWYLASSPRIISIDSHWSALVGLDDPATEQEWRLRHRAGGGAFDDPIIAGAEEITAARRSAEFTRFDGNLESVDGLPDFADGQRLIAPTALERYAGCPHTYFVERILGVVPIESPEDIVSIRSNDIGNIMHEVMEALALEFAESLPGFGEPWTAGQRDRMRTLADEIMVEYERRGLTGHPRLWERERETLLANLEALLDSDDEVRATRDARVVASELQFGSRGVPPVLVNVDAGSVAMRGSADRIDERRDGTLIVTDFKSGSARTFEDIEKDPVVAGKKLQLPLYALAARQEYGAAEVEAEYWFVGSKNRGKRVRIELDDVVAERYRFAVDTLVAGIREGRFPARPPVADDFAWVQCAFCNPDGVGYGHVRADSERKQTDPALANLFALLDPTVHAAGEEEQ